jgi:hypothetical protein
MDYETNPRTTGKPDFVRLTLTEEQKRQVRNTTGVEAEAIELSARELEERIAPRKLVD